MSAANDSAAGASWGDLFRDGRAVYTISLALGIALHATDAFVVSTVMPSVVAEIGGAAFYAWVVMLYMVASIVGAASGGPIKLIFGARRGYVAAGLVFLMGTLLSGSAVSMPMLLSGRLIQGFGAGMIVAQNVALISELFPGPLRTRMIAITSGVWAAAALIGPMIGGVFAQIEFWRGAFWFAVPIILAFTIMAWRSLPDSGPSIEKDISRFPIWRVGLLGIGVLMIGTTGNIDALPIRLGALVAGLALVWLTIRLDRNAENRVFPSRPFSLKGPVGTAYWAFLLIAMAPLAVGIYLPLAYQTIHGLPPLAAGYLAALLALAWSAAAFIAAGLRGRGERIAITLGPALAATGLVGIAFSINGGAIAVTAGFTLVTGLGVGLCMSHLMNWTMILAAPGEESITASSIHTVRSLGVAVGAAGAGLIANAAGLGRGVNVESVTSAVTWVTAITALAPVGAVLLGLLLIARRRQHERAHALAASEAAAE